MWRRKLLLFPLLAVTVVFALGGGPAYASLNTVELLRSPQALFDKRFLIDRQHEELFLVLPRNEESTQIVLVRPDGSKEYSDRHSKDVRWRSGPELEVIQLVQPELGPWQLHTNLPEGQAYYLLDNFSATTNELPKRVFQGEQLQLQVSAEVEGQILDAPLMGLSRIRIRVSEGRKDREPIFLIAAIPDIEAMTAPSDTRTAVTVPVDMAPGIYDMRLQLDFGIFRRELRHRFEVMPSPFNHQLIKAENYLYPHRIDVGLVTSDILRPTTIALSGTVTRPDGSQQEVNIPPSLRWPKPVYIEVLPEGGIYQLTLKATAHLKGQSRTLPPMELRLPSYRFATPPDPMWLKEQKAKRKREESIKKQLEQQANAQAASQQKSSVGGRLLGVAVILLGNVLLLGVGGGVFWWMKRRQNQQGVQELAI